MKIFDELIQISFNENSNQLVIRFNTEDLMKQVIINHEIDFYFKKKGINYEIF